MSGYIKKARRASWLELHIHEELKSRFLRSSIHFSSVAQSCPTLCTQWTAAHQASLSITHSGSLLKLMSIESVRPSNHLILCGPLLLLPSVFPSIKVFSSESVLHNQVARGIGVSASASVLPMNIQKWFSLGLTGLRLSRVFSNTTVRKHQFFRAEFSLWSNCHIHTWLLEKLSIWLDRPLLAK